jgi:hypothetical protein
MHVADWVRGWHWRASAPGTRGQHSRSSQTSSHSRYWRLKRLHMPCTRWVGALIGGTPMGGGSSYGAAHPSRIAALLAWEPPLGPSSPRSLPGSPPGPELAFEVLRRSISGARSPSPRDARSTLQEDSVLAVRRCSGALEAGGAPAGARGATQRRSSRQAGWAGTAAAAAGGGEAGAPADVRCARCWRWARGDSGRQPHGTRVARALRGRQRRALTWARGGRLRQPNDILWPQLPRRLQPAHQGQWPKRLSGPGQVGWGGVGWGAGGQKAHTHALRYAALL